MSKETLQHTMRSKVRVFEDGGIRLLRKGQKGLIHAIFSRFGLVLVLLVLPALLILCDGIVCRTTRGMTHLIGKQEVVK